MKVLNLMTVNNTNTKVCCLYVHIDEYCSLCMCYVILYVKDYFFLLYIPIATDMSTESDYVSNSLGPLNHTNMIF